MFACDFKNLFVLVFVLGTGISFLINQILEFADFKARKNNRGKVPECLRSVPAADNLFTAEKLEKIVDYENAKYLLWIPSSILGTALSLLLVFTGFYPFVFSVVCRVTGIPQGFWSLYFSFLLFSVLSGIPESLLSLPFSLIREFSIEKKFGFSNMTFKLWVTDEIKSLFVSLIPSVLLSALVALAFTFFENSWWFLVGIIVSVFVLAMQVIYPKFLAPLFNKFEPLPEGELRTKLEELLSKTGFKNDGLFVMDASKRSGHSNAYFSGMGKTKRIVLYDTLINQMTADELVAVLGHELGHFKLKHITKRMFVMFPAIFAVLFVLFRFSRMESLYSGFGFDVSGIDLKWIQFIGLTLTMMLWGAVDELLTPFGNIFSRKHEYQADRFSSEVCGNAENLISGLVKLNSENLSELFPSPVYVWWNYSHPTLVQRINALKKTEGSKL